MEISLDGNVSLRVTRALNYQDLGKEFVKQIELDLGKIQNVYVSLKNYQLYFCSSFVILKLVFFFV